jgi:large subunit ribosomal protein L3e
MTHVVRDVERPGSKLHKKEAVEAVSVLECAPMIVVGLVGYVRTPRGLRCLKSVFAQHLSEQFRRTMYKNWYKSKKKAFTKYMKKYDDATQKAYIEKDIAKIKKYSEVVRVIAHTQPNRLRLHAKKANVLEIQINGGNAAAKVDFALNLFEKPFTVDSVFAESELFDAVAVTKGHGYEGVTHRWGTTKLRRKTHKGLRKVACIGAWHPARVGYTVPRAGQNGYHHRTELNKKIYKVGASIETEKNNATLPGDQTQKEITPMGGFPHYGRVREQYLLVKGSVPGPRKRPLVLRKPLIPQTSRISKEPVNIKFIDTSSKFGHGKFQTPEEKRKFMGPTKKSEAATEKAEK